MIKKLLRIRVALMVIFPATADRDAETADGKTCTEGSTDPLYSDFLLIGLDGLLDYNIFMHAVEGMRTFEFRNDKILTIVDYTRASHEKRMFVIDLEHRKLLYHSLVAHGRNSGVHFAEEFSNENRSLMSSPGFYRTAETYQGRHGYSLRLDGLEKGINDRARERAIVIHGADYVSKDFIEKHGRIGLSWGCPALPEELSREIIDVIKEGSCLYIHADGSSYPGHKAE